MKHLRSLALLTLLSSTMLAQAPRQLTLADAEQTSLQRHPKIASASYSAQAAGSVVKEVRAGFQPLLVGNLTTVGADRNTSIAAGTLQTSGLANRAATGVGLTQLITDFGRTASLADSARLRAGAQDRNVAATRAQVLLQVDQAYYNLLAAAEVLKVTQARLDMQRLTLRQVKALAESSLKSTLDVSFAEVLVSESELLFYQSENAVKASHAALSAAIGDDKDSAFDIVDVPLPGRVAYDAESLVEEALKNRPDLAVVRLNQSAAEKFADAEKKLRYPALTVVAAVGAVPLRQDNFSSRYGAAGLNVSIPFLNGGSFAARHAEAESRARGVQKDAEALALQIAAAVRVAWIEADNAWRRIDLTAKLVDQTNKTLRLAKARYEIGLSGILELTQAQLSLTSAQIAAANAKYDYLTRLANLNYTTGAMQ